MISKQATELIRKYGGAVPRYTSYPTAVQFHDGFTEADVQNRLRNLNTKKPVSLYLHIPFCYSLCHYCGCHTKIVNHTDVISAYVDTLCEEIRIASSYAPKGLIVSRIHFGGGSPNYAPTTDIQKILDTIRTSFPGNDSMQIDMECDPRLLNETKIQELAACGIRRVSLGIQDFDDAVQKVVNRIQSPDHIRAQVAALQKSGIKDINFDLIVGLPEQTPDSVRQTILETIDMKPSRIAVFAYAHVPWMKPHQKLLEKYNFPTAETRFFMQEDIKERLCRAGYNAIGIDHYALPEDSLSKAQDAGTMQRNFQGYTDDPATTILGFGLSSISQFEDSYTQNKLDALSYRKEVEKGSLPIGKGYMLTTTDLASKKAIMQIMCRFDLDMREHPTVPSASGYLALLEQDGLIRREHDTITITDKGKPFTRIVASCFDSYFQESSYKKEGRHAKAI